LVGLERDSAQIRMGGLMVGDNFSSRPRLLVRVKRTKKRAKIKESTGVVRNDIIEDSVFNRDSRNTYTSGFDC